MKRSISILLSIFIFIPAFGWSEEHIPLQDVLKRASESNLTLQAQRQELKVLEGQVIQAGAIPNLEIEASISEIPSGEFSSGDDTEKELGFEQTLITGGKRSLRRGAAHWGLEAARASYRAVELDVLRQIKETYWGYSLARERVNLAEQNLKYQQRFLARVQDRFQSGQSKLADVARVKLEVAKASNDLLVAEKNHKVAQSQLNTLMGQTPRQPLPDAEHLKEQVIQLNEETLIQQASANRPEFKTIEASQKAAQSELSLANRLLWTPDLKAGIVLEEGAREDGRNSWGGKLGLAFPVWYRYKGERLSASARKESLGFQSKGLEQMIALEVHEALLEIDLSGEQVKLWKQAVDQATEAARLAEQQYLEGDVDLLVFVQARRDLVGATLDYLEALRNYQVNVASLERSVGINLLEVK